MRFFLSTHKIKMEKKFSKEENKKIILKSLEKLKDCKDEETINLVRRFARYYDDLDNMGEIVYPNISIESDKYKSNYLCNFLEDFIEKAKIIIPGVIKALVDDETLDYFCEDLIFTIYGLNQIKVNTKLVTNNFLSK